MGARADYALRAAAELAARGDGPATAEQLAVAQGIPGKFLEGILTELRRAGLVTSRRGHDGGFRLARPASEISLADVIRAVDGPLAHIRGERPEQVSYPGAAAVLQEVWLALRASERQVLEEVTLAHLVERRLPDRVASLAHSPRSSVPQSSSPPD